MALRSFQDGAIFGETYGSGTPKVLAMHGWGRRGNDFSPVLEGLDALALDLPGFGASPAPDRVIGADGYADIVVQLLEGFDRPPVLVGHSFGGRVAVCVAAKRPELAGDLVLTGVPLLRNSSMRKPSFGYRVLRRLHKVGLISDKKMEDIRRNRGSADYRAAEGVMRDILVTVVNESYEEELTAISKRVELLWGEDDLEVPVEVAEQAHSILPGSNLTVLPGVGHFVPTQAPSAVRSAIQALL